MIKPIEEFVKRRSEALFSLDKDKILKFYELAYSKSEAKKFAKVDEKVFWAAVYKAICNIISAPEDLKAKAEKWLTQNGYANDVIKAMTITEDMVLYALQICSNENYLCYECPLACKKRGVECLDILKQNAYILIRKQKAEIEALKNEKTEAIKKIAERVAIAFYYEFKESITPSMAEKIDEIVREMTEGENGKGG